MKLKQNFEFVDMGDEIVAVPVGENAGEMHGILKVNKEGKEILSLLAEQKDENAVINALSNAYDNDQDEIIEKVSAFIQKLKDIGVVE